MYISAVSTKSKKINHKVIIAFIIIIMMMMIILKEHDPEK